MKYFRLSIWAKPIIILFGIVFFFSSFESKTSDDNGSFLSVPGGKIWYKVTGNGNNIPVVLIHGGPGMSSSYLKPFESISDQRPVIRYDQLGGGRSDKISDTSLMTIKHYVEELDSLRKFLKISKWHVLGHSWGTILALEYYKEHPGNVVSLVMGSAVFDYPLFANHAKSLLLTLPDSLQDAIINCEATGNYKNPNYWKANALFFNKYVCLNPQNIPNDTSDGPFGYNVYVTMQGPSEFTINGTLKNYDITAFLPNIKVPTLFTVGEFDEVGPEIVKGFSSKVPLSKYVLIKGAAHMAHIDAKEYNIKIVRDFLSSTDLLLKKEQK
jgi:proline iminopeptidase